MKRSRPGFTLIEMLVVMAVTGVLITSGIAFMAG
ncbi:MAG: prepilin-type N-terminal cleavage/methylation domain-containing protein, partial [Planctomycetota bacterium]